MVFVPSIYDLQYYKQNPSLPCYCELVVYPSDMILQGLIYNGNHDYLIAVLVYSADGLTQYEDATTYFNYYFAQTNAGQDYFTLRLKSFSPAMCLHACYILRVIVTQSSNSITLFDQYTERYCQNGCCDIPRDITYKQSDVEGDTGGDTINNPAPIDTPNIPPDLPVTFCGNPVIRLSTEFDCVDRFTNEIYGQPFNVLSASGDTFGFVKISNFQGRIVRRPRDIKRDVSYNCTLQRSESAAQYLLEGYEYFPTWKMTEIEGQLHANIINVSDFASSKNYQYDGGTAFAKVENALSCWEIWKLETTLRDCFIRQIFGCNESCANTSGFITFIISNNYQSGSFYDENQLLIGEYSQLLDYYRGLNGITGVNDIDISGTDCGLYAVFTVSGTAYVPTSFFYTYPTQAFRVFGQTNIDLAQYCSTIGTVCANPEIGTITYSDMVCDAPDIGTITYSTISPDTGAITNYGTLWITDTESAIAYQGQVNFSLKTDSISDAEAGETVCFSQEIIGIMSGNCRPLTQPQTCNSTNNPSLPDDTQIVIDTNGFIYFTGCIVLTVDFIATIDVSDLIYNITP